MKKRISLLIVALSLSLFAQTGLKGGSDGIHQQNATSLGQWTISAGLGGEFSGDSWYMVKDGYYKDPEGKTIRLDLISPSISTYAHVSVGLLSFWDVGFVLPLYYDMPYPEYESSKLYGGGIGDIEMWTKLRLPLSTDNVFSLAGIMEVTAPTGTKGTGMHPREIWHINSWGYTDPYTANDWVFIGNLVGTFDFTKIQVPLRWNINAGFAGSLNEGANSVTWGTGLNVIPSSYFDLFVEVSGETRVEKTAIHRSPWDDPMRLTPGVRFHLPAGFDIALGLDVGVNAFRNPSFDYNEDEAYPVIRRKNGETLRYEVVSTAHYAASALLTWKMSFKDKDTDGDGILDKQDQCSNTSKASPVDSIGCPLDSDNDKVLDEKDQCPNTRAGAQVDSVGCPMDADKDGLADEKDKCSNTPVGAIVDDQGCPLDSDKDGVYDHLDKCPNTQEKTNVDETGCSIDSDKDGVMDNLDKCPNTRKGSTVDASGCPTDADKDGVADHLDKCPNTAIGSIVNDQGCAIDSDKDGVFDYLDKCPNTKAEQPVNADGCPIDTDKDGVVDNLDKCPNTSAGLIVDSTGCALDSDRDGVFNSKDHCSNTPEKTPVDANGCPLDQDNDGVPNNLDKCPNTLPKVPVNESGCPSDFDNDGVADINDKCPNTKPGEEVNSIGCILDTDKDGVPDTTDMCPHTLQGIKINDKGCPIDVKQDLSKLNKGINFKPSSKKLTNASYATLDDLVSLLRQTPTANIEVRGHTDNTGSEKYNLELSQDRAQTVVDYFIKKGIDKKRVRAIGYGSERPIADNETAKGRDANRRVELVPFE